MKELPDMARPGRLPVVAGILLEVTVVAVLIIGIYETGRRWLS